MSLRGRAPLAVALAVLLATGCAAVELRRAAGVVEALEAGLAGLIAAGVVVLALSLPGLTWRGAAFGGVFVAAGVSTWAVMTDSGKWITWTLLGAGAVLFAVWSFPWLRDLRALPRLGGFWLGVAYWPLGVIAAALVLNVEVAGERVVYTGIFVVAVLAVLAATRRGRDLSVGVAGVFLLAVAVLLVFGSGNVFDAINPVPDNDWGTGMNRRFWGGELVKYHPNSLALISVVAGVRVAADPAFAAWQRVAVVVLTSFVIFLTESRTAFGVAVIAALLHGYTALRGLVRYPDRRALYRAVALPFVTLALVLVASGGQGFLFKSRYGGEDVTSGRTETWAVVFREWRTAPVADKLFGDTQSTRAVVVRDGNQLPTDNAAVGALRRGGVLGVAAFLLGLGLLLWRVVPGLLRRAPAWWRRAPAWLGSDAGAAAPPWLGILVVAMLPAIAVTDWLLGGTGGTLWIMLTVAEAALVARTPARVAA